jgi:branched-subunit amino acid ABC-type transport system permease component
MAPSTPCSDLATVLVFTVTRVIFIPQGEFVAYGALTLAIFQTGKVPGTVWLLLLMAVLAALMEGVRLTLAAHSAHPGQAP